MCHHQPLTCDDGVVLVAVPGVGAGVAVLRVEAALPLGVAVVERLTAKRQFDR